ncbi:hypothetical protein V9T40_014320 [Parthenolecanium corni]|uniref:TGF-beta family profile domain-containing protein n=1 Tax=Parthenolecanium corni TaxID=536013 RepID=A0AAN9T314_9HEMI
MYLKKGLTINGQKLLEFSWSQDMAAADLNVKSAMLWVRLELKPDSSNRVRKIPPNLNFTFWVFRVIASGLRNATFLSGKEFEERTKLSASLPVTLSSLGWKTFDVTSTVKEWYASPHKDRLRLLVECSGCGDYVTPVLFDDPRQVNEWEKPFLMIQPDPTVTRRVRRRAVDCSRAKRDQCCKQQFYIRFRDIGWHTWIIAPSGYYANYCRGDCGGFHRTPDTYINPHTYALEDYKKINQYSLFEPCCAPVKFSSISMIYITPDQNVIKRDLPKMVVDECGCP